MRYVIFKTKTYGQRIYALDEEDVIEGVGSPCQLCYDISRHSAPGTIADLEVCDLKNCGDCEEHRNGSCSCTGIYGIKDPTVPFDERFCTEFMWRER